MMDHPYIPATGIPYLLLLFDLLKGIAWPAAAAFGFYLFRSSITQALLRLTSVKGPGGVELALQPLAVESTDSLTSSISHGQTDFGRILPTNDAVKEIEESIRKDLDGINLEHRQDALVRAVASERLDKHLALVYATIFGSQIELLKLINEHSGPLGINEARSKYAAIQERHEPLSEVSFERYTGYMINSLLVQVGSDLIEITNVGREFLVFLQRYGLPDNRPL